MLQKPGNHRPVPPDLECRIEQVRTRHTISLSLSLPVIQPHFLASSSGEESGHCSPQLSSVQNFGKNIFEKEAIWRMSLCLCLSSTIYPLYKLHSIQISIRYIETNIFVRNVHQLGARLKARR